jgi:REP element-mobilizing transposase RayT
VAGHASDTRQLFAADVDRAKFLGELAATCERLEIALVSYVLMMNHYHLLVRIPADRLSRALQRLHTRYARAHNRRYGRSAHLFRAHAYAGEIESNEQVVVAACYLARNPVRVGLVRNALAWRWGSARAHAGLERPHLPLTETDLEGAFGEGDDWRVRYRDYVTARDEKAPFPGPFEVAGAGFEPATSPVMRSQTANVRSP